MLELSIAHGVCYQLFIRLWLCCNPVKVFGPPGRISLAIGQVFRNHNISYCGVPFVLDILDLILSVGFSNEFLTYSSYVNEPNIVGNYFSKR